MLGNEANTTYIYIYTVYMYIAVHVCEIEGVYLIVYGMVLQG